MRTMRRAICHARSTLSRHQRTVGVRQDAYHSNPRPVLNVRAPFQVVYTRFGAPDQPTLHQRMGQGRGYHGNSYGFYDHEELRDRTEYSDRSGKDPWEPAMEHLEQLDRDWLAWPPSLNELIRDDIHAARQFFRTVLQVHYPREMRMWNKWGVMEWKAGNMDLARMIFAKAAKIAFHAELWQSWASLEMEAKNYVEAKRLFKVILATDAHNANAGLGMALLDVAMDKKDKARERFQRLHEEHPEDHLILHAYAVFEARNQNMSVARRIFEAATHHERATAQVWHAWAQAEYAWGFYKNAMAVCRRGLSLYPTHKWLLQLFGMVQYRLGEISDARRTFRRLADGSECIEPSTLNAFAKIEEELGNDDTAMELYNEVLSIHTGHIPSIMSLALLHQKKGHMRNARHVFETAMERTKRTGQLCCTWGDFEEQYGDVENARDLYEEATKQEPTNVDAWKGLARVESRLGNVHAARAVLTMATQHIPHDVPLLIQLAKIEQANRNVRGARQALEKALRVNDSDAKVWNLRALLELSRHPDRVKAIVESALQVIPKHERLSRSILYCTYGRACAALEEYEAAVKAFQQSFSLSPKNGETHVIYAETVLVPNEAWQEALKHLYAARNIYRGDSKRSKIIAAKIKAIKQEQSTTTSTEDESGSGEESKEVNNR